MMTSSITGAPICAGGASPLRVATGGSANWSSGVRPRRSPARANRRRDNVLGASADASLFQSSENHGENLTHSGHLFMTKPRASLRSDNCPISIGIRVRFELEQVSAFAGIRTESQKGYFGYGAGLLFGSIVLFVIAACVLPKSAGKKSLQQQIKDAENQIAEAKGKTAELTDKLRPDWELNKYDARNLDGLLREQERRRAFMLQFSQANIL